MLADAHQTPPNSLGDHALDAIRAKWPQANAITSATHALILAASPSQRRQVLLACYKAIVSKRGLDGDDFAKQVIAYAEKSVRGELGAADLDNAYRWAGAFARTSSHRGNCIISSVLLTPVLHDVDMTAHLDMFCREAGTIDLNEVVRGALLGD